MINLLDLERTELVRFFEERGEKSYRATQVFRRLHKSGEDFPDALKDLPQSLRERLCDEVKAQEPPLAADIPAADGVRKLLFDIGDERVEAIIIPETSRLTLCVSSQAGCALACRFCLTGKQGFSGNLSTSQIIAQLRVANRLLATQKISNVVLMGMGEPLLNLNAVIPALHMMSDDAGYALPPRRITVSTAGVVPAMERLRNETNVSLAVSLHAPTDSLRDEIMPINRKYPLSLLLDACRLHIAKQDNRRTYVTFEYVMLAGVNDGDACVRDLLHLLRGVRCKVNLIPFNSFADAPFVCSAREDILSFRDKLLKGGVMTTIRKTRGADILAACGQLAGEINRGGRSLGHREAPVKLIHSSDKHATN